MAQKNVLVVGTLSEELRNIDYLLEASGCRVSLASDVREAFDNLVSRKVPFQNLDLILINNFSLLAQFMEIFTSPICLREKYPIIVLDNLKLQERFRKVFEPPMDDFNIKVCDNHSCLGEIEKTLELDFRDVACH